LSKNILKAANDIINNRSEEKERQYGPLDEGFDRAAMIATGMSGKEFTAHDIFIAMIALKFSRQSYNFKEDNLLDAVAYIGGWQNYINSTIENKEPLTEKSSERGFSGDLKGPDYPGLVSPVAMTNPHDY